MSGFRRYAIYYLLEPGSLADFGASWLGWNVVTGTQTAQPAVEGIEAISATPRRYGFHGTLKPPFQLAVGASGDALAESTEALARTLAPVRLDGLQLSRIGSFLALTPKGDAAQLNSLAFRCVTDLDMHRRPPSDAEIERRRAAGLTQRQEQLLERWGYPYVAEEFRFHLTLSGKLDTDEIDRVAAAIASHLPALPTPFEIASISLVGEGEDGFFRLVHRYALTG